MERAEEWHSRDPRTAAIRSRGGLGCFFFQAEDGIRDYKVTGVQTCALPICATERRHDRGLLGLRRLVAFPDAFSDAAGLVVEILGRLGELALGSDHFGM